MAKSVKKTPLKAVKKKKVVKKKVEEAQIVEELQKFYVKQAGMKSSFVVVLGVSKLDIGMDFAGYSFNEGEKPSIKICKDVYTRAEMVKMGYLPSARKVLTRDW